MPPATRVLTARTRIPAWRRVLALADRAMLPLLTLWRRLFRQTRRRVQQRRLVTALSTHVLEAEAEVAQVLETMLERPARQAVTERGLALAVAAAQVAQDDIERQTGAIGGLAFLLPETRYGLETYVGAQVRDIVQTTRRTVRQTLRNGRQQGLSTAALARDVRAVIGLTPGQAQAREVLRARLEAEGKTPAEVRSALTQATEQALQRRAMLIARTQTVDLVHLGVQEAWEDVVRRGIVIAEAVRRYWIPLEAPGLCPGCASIPGMNPQGVNLHEAFATPWGPKLRPTAHPSCRCSIDYRVERRP